MFRYHVILSPPSSNGRLFSKKGHIMSTVTKCPPFILQNHVIMSAATKCPSFQEICDIKSTSKISDVLEKSSHYIRRYFAKIKIPDQIVSVTICRLTFRQKLYSIYSI